MLSTYDLSELFYFFLSDGSIWHCLLYFMETLFAAGFFILVKCYNFFNSLRDTFPLQPSQIEILKQ